MPEERQEQATNEKTNANETQALDFEEWLKEQDESVRSAFEEHVKGLKSALETEREQRKAFAKQLREAMSKAEKGSEAREALEKALQKAEAAERRANFYVEADKAGVSNLHLAYLAAQADDLLDENGYADFDELKARYPELFKKTAIPSANAGAGAGQSSSSTKSMNEYIRRAAGR